MKMQGPNQTERIIKEPLRGISFIKLAMSALTKSFYGVNSWVNQSAAIIKPALKLKIQVLHAVSVVKFLVKSKLSLITLETLLGDVLQQVELGAVKTRGVRPRHRLRRDLSWSALLLSPSGVVESLAFHSPVGEVSFCLVIELFSYDPVVP